MMNGEIMVTLKLMNPLFSYDRFPPKQQGAVCSERQI